MSSKDSCDGSVVEIDHLVEDVPEEVDFLYRAMHARDPKKRRVKPVETHLLQLDFGGLDDSDDDSDFEVREESDENRSDTSEEKSESFQVSDEGDHEATSESATSIPKTASLNELLEKAKERQQNARVRIASDSGSKKPVDVKICCVCLGDISEPNDEIVECDSCGMSVHEGCYGIADSLSEASTTSSCSTEPWFCDSCRAGAIHPNCELCPNFGGILKETDTGEWVHLVCALYTPGIAFGDVDRLSPVTLLELSHTKWGARECCLCEDDHFSRTGICIKCDAGMCKNYFHVTCAQKNGLLSEAVQAEDIADPFYSYCKLHADKTQATSKRRNWLALQSQCKLSSEKNQCENKTSGEISRFKRKLTRAKNKYSKQKLQWPSSGVPAEKMPRLLTTCPAACRKLAKKAELLGINADTAHARHGAHDELADIRKKWHLPAAFSTEFICYYLDRIERMKAMKTGVDKQIEINKLLKNQQASIRSQYDLLQSEFENLKADGTPLRKDAEQYHTWLCNFFEKDLELPEVLIPVQMPVQKERRKIFQFPVIMHTCSVCDTSHDQHQLVQCDTCLMYYHLACLDPPLTRMPKKSKLYGWQCKACCPTSSSDEDAPPKMIDIDAPRQLRQVIKEPQKFEPNYSHKARDEGLRKQKIVLGKQKKPKKKLIKPHDDIIFVKDDAGSDESKQSSDFIIDFTLKKRGRHTREVDTLVECDKCGAEGSNADLIRCDDCHQTFHFVCVNPPLKKNPKVRGYSWFCESCDPYESSSEDAEKIEEIQDRDSDTEEPMFVDSPGGQDFDVHEAESVKETQPPDIEEWDSGNSLQEIQATDNEEIHDSNTGGSFATNSGQEMQVDINADDESAQAEKVSTSAPGAVTYGRAHSTTARSVSIEVTTASNNLSNSEQGNVLPLELPVMRSPFPRTVSIEAKSLPVEADSRPSAQDEQAELVESRTDASNSMSE